MKKIIAVLFLACALLGYAQDSSIKPEFQAFSGALVKLKKAKNGYHKFMLEIGCQRHKLGWKSFCRNHGTESYAEKYLF